MLLVESLSLKHDLGTYDKAMNLKTGLRTCSNIQNKNVKIKVDPTLNSK